MPIVIDASITMAWCYQDEATALSEVVLGQVEDERAFVPAIWPVEVANAILSGERRGRLSTVNRERFLSMLNALPVMIDEATFIQAWTTILDLARQFRLSVYDASYVELAMRRGVAIATTDHQIIDAARQLKLPLIEAL